MCYQATDSLTTGKKPMVARWDVAGAWVKQVRGLNEGTCHHEHWVT